MSYVLKIIVISIFVDLATNRNVEERLGADRACKSTGGCEQVRAQLIIAETLIAIEKLHSMGIVHMDLAFKNIVIDGGGHILLTDFGHSTQLDEATSQRDWRQFACMCYETYSKPICDENLKNLVDLLLITTDSQLSG